MDGAGTGDGQPAGREYLGTGPDTQQVGDPDDVTVEDADVLVELDGWPTVLAHIRIMGKLDHDATDVT